MIKIKRHFRRKPFLVAVESFALWNFIFFSFLTPTYLDWYRFLTLLVFIICKFLTRDFQQVSKYYLVSIYLIISYNIVQFYIGYLKYGSISIFEAKSTILYYSIFAGLIFLISERNLRTIANAIILSSLFIGLYFFYCLFGQIGFAPYYGDFLKQNYVIAVGIGIIKVYSLQVISLTYTLPFTIVYLITTKNKRNLFDIAVMMVSSLAALFSLIRGIIGSTSIGMLLAFFLRRNKTNYFKWIFISAIIVGIIIFSLQIFFNSIGEKPLKYLGEIASSVNFSTNNSNLTRRDQANFLYNKIKDHPLFGYGIGANDKNYANEAHRTSNFELQYMKILYEVGIIGFLLNFQLVFWAYKKSFKLIKLNEGLLYLLPTLSAFTAALIYNAFNPLLSQFSPMFMFFHLFYVLNSKIKHNEISHTLYL